MPERASPGGVTLNQVIDLLNKLIQLDHDAISRLFIQRVPCNSHLARHHTIQVQLGRQGSPHRVGLLGVINAFFDSDAEGHGPISAQLKDGELTGFIRTNAPPVEPSAITITY